jgi:hypothetical protein
MPLSYLMSLDSMLQITTDTKLIKMIKRRIIIELIIE